MQPCAPGVSRQRRRSTPTRFSDGRHSIHHCVTDFAGNVGCTADQTVADRQQPAGPSAQPDPRRRRGLAPRRRLRPLLGQSRPGAGEPDLAAPPGGSTGPAGYDTGVKFAAGRDLAALADLSVPRARRLLAARSGCATKPATTRRPRRSTCRCASTTCRPESPSSRRGAEDPRADPRRRQRRALRAGRGDDLLPPPQRRTSGPSCRPSCSRPTPASASLLARTPDLAPGTYVFRADAVDAAGNTASTTLRADGTEMAVRKTPPPVAPAERSCRRRSKTRLFARLRGGHGRGDDADGPVRRRRPSLSGRLTRADGAGLAGRELRVVSRPSRGALRRDRASARSPPASAAASSCASAPGPRAGSPSPSRATRGSTPASRPAAGPAGARRRLPAARRRCRCRPARSCGLSGRVAQPRRAAAPARQAGRDPVPGGGDRTAGARSWSPAPTTAAASAPATASATSAAPPRSGCGRRRWRRSAGPTRPAPRAR